MDGVNEETKNDVVRQDNDVAPADDDSDVELLIDFSSSTFTNDADRFNQNEEAKILFARRPSDPGNGSDPEETDLDFSGDESSSNGEESDIEEVESDPEVEEAKPGRADRQKSRRSAESSGNSPEERLIDNICEFFEV